MKEKDEVQSRREVALGQRWSVVGRFFGSEAGPCARFIILCEECGATHRASDDALRESEAR